MKFWVTYNPRNPETINQSIESFRQAGILDPIYVFAEPNTHEFKDNNLFIIQNTEKRGCFLNFDYMLKYFQELKEPLFTFQSDYIARQGIKEELERIEKSNEDYAYYNFILDWRSANYIKKQGWNDVKNGWYQIWACFLFKDIQRIINHPFYQKHLTEYVPKKNQQIDACIWEVGKQLWLPCYLPSHSYIAHIWESTIGHNDKNLWVFFNIF